MKYKIVFHPEATKEYIDAYEWYEERQSGLGEEFISSVDDAIAEIIAHPAHSRPETEDCRIKVVKTFPYIILYEVLKKGNVVKNGWFFY